MSEPLKGGQQFFSNYLRAFGETVDKQTEIVDSLTQIYIRLNDAVPKYAQVSDNIQKTDNVVVSKNGDAAILKSLKMFISGQIRFKIDASQVGPVSSQISVKVNGVNIMSSSFFTGSKLITFDVPIEEGDLILLTTDGSGIGNITNINKIDLCYDLNNKPDVVIG